WANYLPAAVVADFEREAGCTVATREFATNEELETILQGDATSWDVGFPSDYMVEKLARAGKLRELERGKLSNFANLDPNFLDRPFDPRNRHSVPFNWGIAAIGYHRKKVYPPPTDYDVLWNPHYAGKIGLIDDMRQVIAIPLIWKGHRVDTTQAEQLAEAGRLLAQLKPQVKVFAKEDYAGLLLREEVLLFYGYVDDLVRAARENPVLGVMIPESGAVYYQDALCVPTVCDQPELAHRFINYLLRADVSARITNTNWAAMPNLAAEALVRPDVGDDPVVYPTRAVLRRCQAFALDMPSLPQYEGLWKDFRGE
ncbi:MAG: spermidine/putrescine ABC transporter substrate-binding protein, partial [Planctomycetes bacterium]|nr:spermidine/putrescine ABC transporter substrate-binding protein [Planctomycetota bacterium]